MDETEIIAALVALAKQHPYAALALGLWLALSLGWKAQPKEKRETWAAMSPRLVGVLRVALELLPDLLGAARVLLWQVVRGQAARPEMRDEPLAGTGEGVQINSDDTPPIRRETQAPPPPSEPGFAETRILAAIAVASALALVALLSGCSAGQTPVLSPIAPRVIERAEYGTCAETGGKVEIPSAGQIALLTSVCWLRADSGAALDASPEPEPAAVADKSDAAGGE
jgi:hypothetical protein